jgi:ABC-type sugar transport system substrate-binding protein
MYISQSGHGRRRWAFMLMLLVLALGLTVSACGGGSSSSSSSSEETTAEPAETTEEPAEEEEEVSEESSGGEVTPAVEKLMSQALGVPYKEGDFDQTGIEAFVKASETAELTPEQEELAFECWSKSSCTLGEGELTYGVADGFGGNTWRKFTKMEGILQAMAYPEIGKYIYLDANGDLSKMQANIRSLSAQGVNILTTYDDFGAAVDPAFEAAQRAGAVVSNFVGPVEAEESAIDVHAQNDFCTAGKAMIDAAAKMVGNKGSVAYLSGTPGNPQGEEWQGCADEEIESKYPELEVTYKGDTEWTAAGTTKATSAMIASGKPVDVVIYDYAEPVQQIVSTYEKAGKTPPAVVATSSSNGTLIAWDKSQGGSKAWDYAQTSSLAYVQRLSITGAINKLNGEEVPNEVKVPVAYIPATKEQVEAEKPGDYPGPTIIVPSKLVEKMLSAG